MSAALELADWRRRVAELYAQVRGTADPAEAHVRWRAGRDALFRDHPQSPLAADYPLRSTGLPYAPYDPDLRFVLPLLPVRDADARLELDSGADAGTRLASVGHVALPEPLGGSLDVWSLQQYGGGLFLPLRDGSSGRASDGFTSYGGGRYLLDTAKGADLGGDAEHLVVDLNFAFHPSCRYDSRWLCPLAPAGNTIAATVRAGEQLDPS